MASDRNEPELEEGEIGDWDDSVDQPDGKIRTRSSPAPGNLSSRRTNAQSSNISASQSSSFSSRTTKCYRKYRSNCNAKYGSNSRGGSWTRKGRAAPYMRIPPAIRRTNEPDLCHAMPKPEGVFHGDRLRRKPSFCSSRYSDLDSRSSKHSDMNASHSWKPFHTGGKTPRLSPLGTKFGAPVKHAKGSSGKTKPFMEKRTSRNCPDSDTEASYDDLLDQYRSIKAQLASLNSKTSKPSRSASSSRGDRETFHSDEAVGVDKENKCQRRRKSRSKQRNPSGSEVVKCNGGKSSRHHASLIRTSKADDEKSSEHHASCISSPILCSAQNDSTDNQEEEEDEEELRRIALASALWKNSKGLSATDIQSEVSKETQESLFSILGDNYETVEMEIDTEDDTSDGKPVPQKPSEGVMESGGDDDLNEEELRELLLKSLAARHRTIKDFQEVKEDIDDAEVPVSNTTLSESEKMLEIVQDSNNSALPKDASTKTLDDSVKENLLPIRLSEQHVAPVIINLGEDSSDESADELKETCDEKQLPVKDSIAAGVEQFLKAARQKSNETNSVVPQRSVIKPLSSTPSAVYQLSRAQQVEYRKLKAEIARREQSRRPEKALTVSNNAKEEKKNLEMRKLAESESELKKQRLLLKLEQQKLNSLKSKVTTKKTARRKVEVKVQDLRKKLAMAEKMLQMATQELGKLTAEMTEAQATVDQKLLKVTELESSCKSLGSALMGSAYQLPAIAAKNTMKERVALNSSKLQLAVKRFRTSQYNSNKNSSGSLLSQNSQSRAKSFGPQTKASRLEEKKRLQAMEKMLSQKLSALQKKSGLANSTSTVFQKCVPLGSESVSAPDVARNASPTVDANKSDPDTSRNIGTSEAAETVSQHISEDHVPSLSVEQLDIVKALHKSNLKGILELSSEMEQLMGLSWTNKCITPEELQIRYKSNPESTTTRSSEKSCDDVLQCYESPLLAMGSYRLSPHFKGDFLKYVYKIDPKRQMCKFDLLGMCNDDKCIWQHSKEYSVTPREVVFDLLCYSPSIAGVSENDSTDDARKKIENSASSFLDASKANDDSEALFRSVVDEVNKNLGSVAPHFIQLEKRQLSLKTSPHIIQMEEKTSDAIVKPRKGYHTRSFNQDFDPDAVVDENDLRYFRMGGYDKAQDGLEKALEEDPQNIHLWLKLAYQQLTKDWDLDELDRALNVLSRGLENNQDNPELWQHYLSLYAKHPASNDLETLCQQAVEFCPHYDVWWKYLQLVEGCDRKEQIAEKILEFLLMRRNHLEATVLSHCLLEIILFQTLLLIFKGHAKKAEKYLQMCLIPNKVTAEAATKLLPSDDDVIPLDVTSRTEDTDAEMPHLSVLLPDLLIPSDHCFAWLCYLHLMVSGTLPFNIFDSGHEALGHLVNKEPFLVPWHLSSDLSSHSDLLKAAIDKCTSDGKPNKAVFPLYWNRVALELHQQRFELAAEACKELIHILPSIPRVWLQLSRLWFDLPLIKCMQIVTKDIVVQNNQPHTCYVIAKCAKVNLNCDQALTVLEKYVKGFYIPDAEYTGSTVLQMYCTLLGCDHEGVTANGKDLGKYLKKESLSDEEVLFMWLNFILWLDLKREPSSQICAFFEKALCWAKTSEFSALLWWEYLQYCGSEVLHSSDKTSSFSQFTALVHRCLVTMPIKKPVELDPSKTWTDYSFHNSVIDFYCKHLLPSEEAFACQSFLSLLPGNITLLKKTVIAFIKASKNQNALSCLKKMLNQNVTDTSLWKIAIRLIYEENDHHEIHHIYHLALEALPYSTVIWRDYLLYELSQNHMGHFHQALNMGKKLQIHGLKEFTEFLA